MKKIMIDNGLADELDIWLTAFRNLYGEDYPLSRMLSGLLDSIEDIHPEIIEEVGRMAEEDPAVLDRMGNRC